MMTTYHKIEIIIPRPSILRICIYEIASSYASHDNSIHCKQHESRNIILRKSNFCIDEDDSHVPVVVPPMMVFPIHHYSFTFIPKTWRTQHTKHLTIQPHLWRSFVQCNNALIVSLWKTYISTLLFKVRHCSV